MALPGGRARRVLAPPPHVRAPLPSDNVRQHLGAHRTEFRDFSTIVDYTANYNDVNNAIAKLKSLRRNTLTFYNPTQGEAKRVMAKLADLEPIHFGQVLLSYSFWVLVGIMVYLLLNSPRILKFKSWEVGYFIVMTILFFTILVTLPAAYGRYRFEFKIQKLNDIVFTGETGGPGAIRQKLEELRRKNATLFLLGPTKGKEVILGAVGSQDPAVITPQLIMLERDTFKFMTVEPVRNEDIPQIVKLLRQNR